MPTTGARSDGSAADEMLSYMEARKSLKTAITRKKNYAFHELRDDVIPYGLGYKIVMDKLNRRKPMAIMDEREI